MSILERYDTDEAFQVKVFLLLHRLNLTRSCRVRGVRRALIRNIKVLEELQ